jgi:hypothetical protein
VFETFGRRRHSLFSCLNPRLLHSRNQEGWRNLSRRGSLGRDQLHGWSHPSRISQLAPEMDEIADDLLGILEANGKYQIGFCLRQQQIIVRNDPNQPFYFQAWSEPDGEASRQDLEQEINWARTRWGQHVTMFYVDSNQGNEVKN